MRTDPLKDWFVPNLLQGPSVATMLTSDAGGFNTCIFMSENGYSVIGAWFGQG